MAGDVADEVVAQDAGAVLADPLVVVLGASAGGIAALRRFLGALPERPGHCFLLAQHLAPGDEPLLAEVLGRATRLKVMIAKPGLHPEPDSLLVVPPGMDVAFRAGRLSPRRRVGKAGDERRDPIDRLFRAAAEAFGPSVVGVVLSGTGTDGTMGLQAVGGAGGLCMAQDGGSAAHTDMPDAAAASGFADHVGPPEALAAALADHARHRMSRVAALGGPAQARAELLALLPEICAILRERTGHDFRHYKSATLVRRTERRLRVLRLDTPAAYVERLRADKHEPATLFRELLIGVTSFFRDAEAFEVLAARAIGPLLEGRAPQEPLRIWVAGCATGEEAYTVAMLVREALDRLPAPPPVQIFATDVNDRALAAARRGAYSATIAGDLSPERLGRFFVRRGRGFQVTEELRAMCLFSPHNVISDPPFSRLDLICCRNLLIYLGAHLQKKLLPVFHYALKPDGFLFLGASETLSGHGELFRPVEARHRLAQRKPVPVAARPDRPEPRPAVPFRDGLGAREGVAMPGGVMEADLGAVTQRILLHEFAPPYAVVTADGGILFLSEGVDRYLQPPSGSFTSSILRMARRGLGIGLRAALSEAARTRRTVVRDGIVVRAQDGPQPLRLTVQPMPELGHGEALFMLVFQPAPTTALGNRILTPAPDAEAVIGQLERELVRTREDLERTVQDLEAANEELKASNEELLSMNEELQSSNEELETSKEEVQAANAALAAANADLENLLRATRIATVFLDAEGRVRGYTPAVAEIYPIGPSDIGRPLADLTPRLAALPPLPDPAVLEGAGEAMEHEAETPDGRWFLRRVLPYRNGGPSPTGLVVTFLDVTRRKADERALAEQAQRLRLAQEAGGVGSWDWDAPTDRADWTEGMYRLLGLPLGAPAGLAPFRERVVPEDRPALDAAMARAAATGRLEGEFRIRRAGDGELRWLTGRGEAERDGDGRILRMVGVNVDVTDLRLAEAATRATLAELQTIYDTAPVGLCVLDADLRFRRINERLAEINGASAADHVGRTVREMVPDLADQAEAALRRVIETGEATLGIVLEGETPAQPGVRRVWEEDWLPLKDEAERVVGVSIVAVEVTGRRAAEAANARLAAIVASSADAIVSYDAESGRIATWNAGAEALFGWTEAEAVGAPRAMLLPDAPPPPEAPDIFHRVLAGGEVRDHETIRRTRDGTTIPVAVTATRMLSAEGRVLGVSAIFRDLRPRRAADAALREERDRLAFVLRATDTGVFEIDVATGVLRCSETFRRGFDVGPHEAFSSVEHLLARLDPAERAIQDAELKQVLADGGDYRAEWGLASASGRRWILMIGRDVPAADGRRSLSGIALDITTRKLDEERKTLLAREVDHRAKNALAVVQAALRLTPRHDAESYARAVEGRVAALARAHTLLAQGMWEGAALRALLEAELAPFTADRGTMDGTMPRVDLSGPDLHLAPTAAQALSMALHELATNATKHGALGAGGGKVEVTWAVEDEGRTLRLAWRERGGPSISGAPTRSGFGSRVLEATIRRQLHGQIRHHWEEPGLVCVLEVPMAYARANGHADFSV
jgi:two-component system CheB/CheR fusion protein